LITHAKLVINEPEVNPYLFNIKDLDKIVHKKTAFEQVKTSYDFNKAFDSLDATRLSL
jgi:hypothetical protein